MVHPGRSRGRRHRLASVGGADLSAPFTGVYAYADHRQLRRVAALAGIGASKDPAAVASHHTAAALWGAIAPSTGTVPSGNTRRRPRGLVVHTADRSSTWHRGVPITSPAQTFVDMATYLPLLDLMVLGDSMVRRTAATPADLVVAASATRGRNARLARRVARLVRADVDSPMETTTRLLIALAGLPEPVVNHVIRDVDGALRRRLDMAYVEARLAVEYDGRQHAESNVQWQVDVGRREELDGDGWRMMVVMAKDIYRTPVHTVDRLRAAMRRAGIPIGAGSDEWRDHFPPR